MTDAPEEDLEEFAEQGQLGGAVDPEDAANVDAMGKWDVVVEDMEATASEYEAEGWETLQLHPGDVTPEPGEDEDLAPGLDVVLPGDEYETLADHVESGFAVDEIDVFRADAEALTYVLFSLLDHDTGVAVFAPTYYRPVDDDVTTLFENALDEGSLQLYLRQLSGEYVAVTVEDPELVAPDDEADDREALAGEELVDEDDLTDDDPADGDDPADEDGT